MKIQDVIDEMQKWAPLAYAEDFDNVGLLVGNSENKVSKTLITLDTLESVIEEAIEKDCNLIISFHPIVFEGLKKITGANYVERVVQKAIKNDIAIYAVHTALDNHFYGVNHQICEQLGLNNRSILIPQQGTLQKLSTYVPLDSLEAVRESLFDAGAGNLGNYDQCSFVNQGKGSFRGNDQSNPTLGKKNQWHQENEANLNLTFPKHLQSKVLSTLFKTHPYEEVAYELTALENTYQKIGMGMVGELSQPLAETEFLDFVKNRMKTPLIRHSQLLGKSIQKVAVLGGSGSFAIEKALQKRADVLITSDLKYHDFFKAENRLVVMDIGHFESEQFTKKLMMDYLTKKMPNFAFVLSETNTNPVNYS